MHLILDLAPRQARGKLKLWTLAVHMAHQGIFNPPSESTQQYYPNPYPHSPALIQPHPSSNAHHVPNQHYPSLARPSSSFMPPPSTLPDDVNKWRNLQPQRPNLWPRDLTEEQRQLQDRYSQNGELHYHTFRACSCLTCHL